MKSTSERQTEKLGRRLAKTFSGGETVLLVGELGAGKTRFAKGIARGLGVKETVTSPTFALHNRYRGKKLFLNHFDFYRLSDGDEARAAGLTTVWWATTICTSWTLRTTTPAAASSTPLKPKTP